MLDQFWYYFLFQPFFNALIWIYINIAGFDLGWAVVWMTIFLRVLLLPLSIVSVFTADRREKAADESRRAALAYKNDRIAQREATRLVMKKYHISPWAAVLNLGIQLLVLVLLYQVFLQGITGEHVIKTLYPVIDYPGKINTNFYGFDVGHSHDGVWAGLAALYLLVSILLPARGQKHWEKSEMYFVIFFPIITFFALWYLPMVKSLFILTTMAFSDIIKIMHSMVHSSPKKATSTAPASASPPKKQH